MSRQTDALMGLGSLGIVGNDPDYITQLVSDVRRFAEVLLSLKEAFSATGEALMWCVCVCDLFPFLSLVWISFHSARSN